METQPNIRVLKAVVIVLGLLIIISITVIAVTLYRRMNPSTPAPAVAAEAAPGIPAAAHPMALEPAKPFGDHKVDLPAGARLIETRMVGERMFLRARLLGGNEVWVILSLATGQRLGSFELGTAAE